MEFQVHGPGPVKHVAANPDVTPYVSKGAPNAESSAKLAHFSSHSGVLVQLPKLYSGSANLGSCKISPRILLKKVFKYSGKGLFLLQKREAVLSPRTLEKKKTCW